MDQFILNPMINLLLVIYDLLWHNFGVAIIVFTAVIRILTLPLTLQQQRSMQKMTALQQSKQWLDLQKKYKDDKQRMQQEQMKLYQEMGINPLAGCLPTLIQLPIIFGLYGAIIRALAGTPLDLLDLAGRIYSQVYTRLLPLNSQFLWMNLGQPERLPVGFLSGVPLLADGIPVLAIVVVITTYLQTKLSTPSTATGGQGAQMNQMMTLYMPILLGYFAYTLNAGLALYFVASNVLAIAQYALVRKPKPAPK